ncbi:MAG: hypothetical protein ACOX3T_02085 [Bdellovibrionota bacterium]
MILKKDKKKLFKISLATILVATILFCLLLMLKSQNFFNDPGFLWHLRDGVKPVIDDRNTLLGEESYKNYFLSLKSSDNMKQYSIKEKAKYTLVDGKSSIDKKLFKSNDFLLLFRDNKHALYEMKN